LAVVGPLAALAVFVARLDGGWSPGMVSPWARWWVESVMSPNTVGWILGGSAMLGGIGLLIKRPSMLWLGSLIGLLVTVVFVLLARVTPVINPRPPLELASASCAQTDSVAVAFYGTPMRFDVWANFGCPATTDGSHYWMFSLLTNVGRGNTTNTYPLKDLGDGSRAASYSFSPDDPTVNRCYFVGLVPPAERDRVETKRADHDAFIDDEFPSEVKEVSQCLPPNPEPYQ
jgi:hypothetical protein